MVENGNKGTEKFAMEETNDIVRMLFVGSPLLDISAKCGADELRRFGLNEDDCVRAGDEHDFLFRQLYLNPDSLLTAGGSAQNAARVAKWVLGGKGEVTFAGCAGTDDFEKWMRSRLLSEGVVPLYVQVPEAKTGVCACFLTPEGKRSMCTRQGASAMFSVQHLDLEDFRSKLGQAHCIFIVGYFLVHSPNVVKTLSELCTPSQVFSLSLSAEYVCHDHVEALLQVMPRVDVLLGNEAEVKAFARAMGADEKVTVIEAIHSIRQLRRPANVQPRILVVTRNSEPVILDNGSQDLLFFPVSAGVPVVDSVGCGDALAGAFLASYLSTRNVYSAVRAGIRAALVILQVPGCNPPLDQQTEMIRTG